MMQPHPAARAFPAPAKLNLDLRIIGRRADGYHLLESIFCLIDLCDTVWLLPREDGQIILHNPAGGIPSEQDLSHRAARHTHGRLSSRAASAASVVADAVFAVVGVVGVTGAKELA